MIEKMYEGGRLFLENHDYILNNVFMFDWESDLFAISKTGYSVEIEVKVSRSDFFADFKKRKHEYFKRSIEKEKFIITNQKEFDDICYLDIYKIEERSPNRFYFACPEGMIKPEEVPSYAGLIWCESRYANYHVAKKAPILHRNKIDFNSKLLSKYYHTSLNTRSRINQLLYRMKQNVFCEADIEKELKSIVRLLK